MCRGLAQHLEVLPIDADGGGRRLQMPTCLLVEILGFAGPLGAILLHHDTSPSAQACP